MYMNIFNKSNCIKKCLLRAITCVINEKIYFIKPITRSYAYHMVILTRELATAMEIADRVI